MTVKEMIKKMNTYNALAKEIGGNPATLWFKVGYMESEEIKTFAQFKKMIKEEFIDEMANAILTCDRYEFNEDTQVSAVSNWGDQFTRTVEIWTE